MFLTKTWILFCLISILTGKWEWVKGKLWLLVLTEGLQGVYASFPLVIAILLVNIRGCANSSFLGVKCRHCDIIALVIFSEHMTSPSLTTPTYTCPFCALNSNVGLFFRKYVQDFSYVALRFQHALAGYLWSQFSFQKRESRKMNLLAVMLPLICWKLIKWPVQTLF